MVIGYNRFYRRAQLAGNIARVTRTATNAPKHAASRRRPAKSPWLRSPARRLEAAGLALGLLAGTGLAGAWLTARNPGHPSSPHVLGAGPSSPIRIATDAQLNPATLDEQWAGYSDHSTCADWAGGDGVSAIRLNSGQLAWFFADTFLGPASPTTGFSHPSGFVNNSVVIQTSAGQQSSFVTLTGGGACGGPSKVLGKRVYAVVRPGLAPGARRERYWDEDGVRIGGTIVKFYNRFLPGGVPFIPTGTVMAAFPVSQLSAAGHGSAYGLVARPAVIPVPSSTPPAGGTPIMWGAAVLRAGNTIYVYGTQTPEPSAPQRQLYLARVPAAQLTRFAAWQFYSGAGQWADGQQNAQPVQPAGSGLAVSSGFSVVETGSRYWLIEATPQPGSQDIVAYPAAGPWGPFDESAGITLYRNSEVGLDAAHDYRIMYEARAELALSSSHTLVISYNVNSEAVNTGCVSLSAFTNTVVQPKFIAVPMAVFAGGGAAGQQVTAGPSDYPVIVPRDPSQWFDSWSYSGGCPPVPGLAGVRARSRAGAVTLTWPDDGLDISYRVYLAGPGESGNMPVLVAHSDDATITGLRPGEYQATVVPVNFRQTAGSSATVQFVVR
jgi:hypothetical protein